jgi:iron complex outermembrane recepter protein
MKASHHSNGSSRLVRYAARAILALGAVYTGAASAQAQGNATVPDVPSGQSGTGREDGALQEVVVSGYRSSLEQAIIIKRDTEAETDTILAEDIGKFPDQNLAESLQRIPGVAITREEGEGRELTVRGLGPQFTRVRINGMETLTTTGGPDNEGCVNRTRSFDFNIFSSDLFNSLTVRKTS